MSTRKLYDMDAYQITFEGKIISCNKCEDDTCYRVVLDQTLFFPEEGGQSPDKGILGGANVLDVQIMGDVIIHTIDRELEEGAMVEGAIDWNHRFSNMQQHSGEHIFSGLTYKKYGYQNVGFHLSDQIVTMDFDGPLTMQQVEELEWEVNRVIAENVPVKTGYPDKETLAKLMYRSKKEIEGAIRIVEFEGYDICACCAPHVARTGEIGGFKIQSVQNYKGGVRISYLCGFRALDEAKKKAQILSELSGILTTSQESLAENVQKLKVKNQNLQLQLNQAKQALMEYKLEQLPTGKRDVLLFEKEIEASVMRHVINRLVENHEGICGIFVGDDTEGYQFIIGSRERDCRQIATLMRQQLGAKGGGSPAMIQGSVNSVKTEIEGCVKTEIEGCLALCD